MIIPQHLTLRAAARRLVLIGVMAVGAMVSAEAQVRYVKAAAPAGGNGLSWATAFNTLEAAITNVPQDGEIWVAAATYKPAVTVPVQTGYVITKRMKIYGGFRGNEGTIQARKGYFLQTILDGDVLGTPFNPSDDASHVIQVLGVPGVTGSAPGVIIDGFQITHGYASTDPVLANKGGGGILSQCSDLDLANCFIRSCCAPNGAGLFFGCTGLQEILPHRLHIKLSEFNSNVADQRGGGIYGKLLKGEVVNTQFLSNTATIEGGGAYLANMALGAESTATFDFTNCTFWYNHADFYGGSFGGGISLGFLINGARSVITNCSMAFNFVNNCQNPSSGQAVFVDSHSIGTINNSILHWNDDPQLPCNPFVSPIGGTPTVNYSQVQGAWTGPGGNNLSVADPLFTNVSVGNLTLVVNLSGTSSPCIDAADYARVPLDNLDVDGDGNFGQLLPIDLAGSARYFNIQAINDTGAPPNPALDMGAYEHP